MRAATFSGGIHPKYNKDRTAAMKVEPLSTPKELVLPLSQHIGAPSKASVEVGDQVLAGQEVAQAGGFVSAPIHSSVSGKVTAIEPRLGGTGVPIMSIVIENDGEYNQVEFAPLGSWANAGADDIKSKISGCGIVGLGGAECPTHV